MLKQREKKLNEPTRHGDFFGGWNPLHQQYEIIVGPEARGSHDDAEYFHMPHNIFHELDEMMKQMFSGFGRIEIDESLPNAGDYEGKCTPPH